MKNDFTLLITGSENNENAASGLVPAGREIVCFRPAYVPPYGEFRQIKKLQARLGASGYMKGRTVGCILDLSEWIGHENEEYFILLLKYLHDHRSRISFVFTAGANTEEQTKQLYFRLRCYLRGSIAADMTFLNPGTLCGYIESKGFAHAAAGILAELIMSDGMSDLRSYPMLDMICGELREFCECEGTVDEKMTLGYLNNPDSLPHILDARITGGLITKYENKRPEPVTA